MPSPAYVDTFSRAPQWINRHDAARSFGRLCSRLSRLTRCLGPEGSGHFRRHTFGVLPSPLWGGVGGGGSGWRTLLGRQLRPPSPALPHKGGGSRPAFAGRGCFPRRGRLSPCELV